MGNKAIPALCLLVVAGILVAALWPFNPHPRNEVTWTPKGLWFGDYGSIRTLSDTARPASRDGSCSLEIWLTPGVTDDFNVILAYARRENPLQFRVGQSGDSFYAIRIPNGSLTKGPYINVPHVFSAGKPVLLTITASPRGTRVYVDGKLAKTRADYGLSADDLAGRMVVANSPVGNSTWSGLLQGIAIYGSELSAEDVARHYDVWIAGDRPSLVNLGSDALYLFPGGAGKVIHNLGASTQPDLYIPDSYTILFPAFLRPFWKDSYESFSAIKDISNNVVAFIPLGFLFAAWFSRFLPRQRSVLYSILLGSLLSLTVEILQYFIPMRISDSMDWITNTTGTIIGTRLFVLQARHDWLGRLPVVGRIWSALDHSNSHLSDSDVAGSDLQDIRSDARSEALAVLHARTDVTNK
ncbi:MAG: VanZ family protein [Terriglobales bacterium]